MSTYAPQLPQAALGRRTRHAVLPPVLVPGVLLFSIVLMRLPQALGASRMAAVVSLLPVVAACGALLMRRPAWSVSRLVVPLAAYVVLLLVATVRGVGAETISRNGAQLAIAQIVLLATLGLLAFCREPNARRRRRHLEALCWAPAVFVAVNVVLLHLGFDGRSLAQSRVVPGEANTLALLGYDATRAFFPLAAGVNQFGPVAGVALAVCVSMFLFGHRRRLALPGALLAAYALLLVDSRGSMLFALLAVAIVYLTPAARRRGLGWLTFAVPALPIVIIVGLAAIGDTSVGSALSRDEAQSITSGTGRTFVWGEVVKEMQQPSLDHVFGWGRDGEVASEISEGYAWLFGASRQRLQNNVHNFLLQTFVDLGWVGVFTVILLASSLLRRLGRRGVEHPYPVLLTAVLTTVLVGVVEATPDPQHIDMFAFWILAICAGTRAMPLRD